MTTTSTRQLILVRHGQPDEGHVTQPGDPPLTAIGHAQARVLALRRLAAEPIDRIVCSPQQRALDTAAALSRLLGLQIEVIDGLAECDRANARYRSSETIRREEPERWEEFLASPPRFVGCDPAAFRQTVLDTVAALLANERARTTAVFTHGMPIRTLCTHLMGLSRGEFLSIDHCSLTRVTGSSLGDARIRSLNESTP